MLILLAVIFSMLNGAIMPSMALVFGKITDAAADDQKDDFKHKMRKDGYIMLLLGLAILATSAVALILWTIVGRNQMENMQRDYFSSIIRKSATWYDKEKPGKLASAYYEHLSSFTEIYGNKMHIFFQTIGMSLGGFVIGFYKGWLVSVIIFFIIPVMGVAVFFMNIYSGKSDQMEREAYSKAGSISNQAFEYIRTVKSLTGEEHEIHKYTDSLSGVEKSNQEFTWKIALTFAFFNFSISFMYSSVILLGNIVSNHNWNNDNTGHRYTSGDFISVFFGILIGVFSITVIAPIQMSIAKASVAMARVNQIVNEDNMDPSGSLVPKEDDIWGEIKFENVSFAYPVAPDKLVLDDVSFTIKPGEKFAIVGPSGSGKSTIIQLLERFYDPTEGRILLDGMDIRDIDINCYRRVLGLVSQQPVLFADTIRNNLKMGIEDADVEEEEIWDALERANIKQFVQENLEEGLETYVGTQGSQLSGGQKQRLSIARTLLRKPKVFLFDEATSALDRKNEKQIQDTIDEVCEQCTSVSIAHRLLTIKNSDQIVVLVEGKVVEQGIHEELMGIDDGVYNDLYSKQQAKYQDDLEKNDEGSNEKAEDSVPDEDKQLIKDEIEGDDKEKEDEKKIDLINTDHYLEPRDKAMIYVGVFLSVIVGSNFPIIGFLLGKLIKLLSNYDQLHDPSIDPDTLPFDKDSLWTDGMNYFAIGFSTACIVLFSSFLQQWFFAYVAEKFVLRIRAVLFRKYLYKDVEFFDDEGNKPGTLSQKLSEDCRTIRTLVGMYLGTILQSLSSFGIGLGFGFAGSWRITLVVLALSPLLFIGGMVQSAVYFEGGTADNESEDKNLIQETFNNIKVAA